MFPTSDEKMSWVTEVLIICSPEEYENSEERWFSRIPGHPEAGKDPVPIQEINQWLEDRDFSPLTRLDHHIESEKMFDPLLFADALNFLPIDEFMSFIKKRNWSAPKQLMILIQDQEESEFTIHKIS